MQQSLSRGRCAADSANTVQVSADLSVWRSSDGTGETDGGTLNISG